MNPSQRLYRQPIPNRKPDGEFATFQSWVNKATSWICGRNALCVDAKDRICAIGGDFMRADQEGAFPVRFYYDAGGETPAEQRQSRRLAKAALRLHYPWRYR